MDLRKGFRRIRRRCVYAGGTLLPALLVAALVVPATPSRAQTTPSPPSPLFADDAPLALTIAMDFDVVLNDREEERDYQPATLYEPGKSAEAAHSIGIKTRGYYRLHYLDCDVPPLRLNLKKKEVDGSGASSTPPARSNDSFSEQAATNLQTTFSDGK